MSLATSREPWIDTWWPLLLIAFGILFVTFLVSFKPGDRDTTKEHQPAASIRMPDGAARVA